MSRLIFSKLSQAMADTASTDGQLYLKSDDKLYLKTGSDAEVPVGGGLGGMEVFTSSGTYTVPSGVTKVKVTCVGGGGTSGVASSGSPAGGGGSGAVCIKLISNLSSSETVTVGSGGGQYGTDGSHNTGGHGGDSSFGSHMTAGGGRGGYNNGNSGSYGQGMGGNGGTATGGDVNLNGFKGINLEGASTPLGFGYAGRSDEMSGTTGVDAPQGYGSGGGGGIQTTNGLGADGIVIVEW